VPVRPWRVAAAVAFAVDAPGVFVVSAPTITGAKTTTGGMARRLRGGVAVSLSEASGFVAVVAGFGLSGKPMCGSGRPMGGSGGTGSMMLLAGSGAEVVCA
jgi:hypothetical protein